MMFEDVWGIWPDLKYPSHVLKAIEAHWVATRAARVQRLPRWESPETWWWAGEPSNFGRVVQTISNDYMCVCVCKSNHFEVDVFEEQWIMDIMATSIFSLDNRDLRISNPRPFWTPSKSAQAQTPARRDGRCSPLTGGQRGRMLVEHGGRCWKSYTSMMALPINFSAVKRGFCMFLL